ncbi:MAG: glycosyltransferase [Acidobacteriaceae bacterium]
MSPILSIVMPTYNGGQFIAAALESVRQQQDDRIELVIVDDGSTDDTLDIVRSFARVLPIRLITPGRIGNWVAATNLGLREATGDWACLLHQDDLWLPGRLERIRPEMENTEGVFILHNATYVGPDGRTLGAWTCPFSPGTVPPALFIERLLIQNFIAIPSPVFRRDVVVHTGGMDEALWFSADWDLWLRLGALGPVGFIAETLTAFRIHPASQTAARKLQPNEWDEQLSTVLVRHMENWPPKGRLRSSVERVAMASIAVNSALSIASRGGPIKPGRVLWQLFTLGPLGWWRYLRDSRIVQRVQSRLKLQLLARFRQVHATP